MTPLDFINLVLNVYSNVLVGAIAVVSLLFGIFYRTFFNVVSTVGRGISSAISSVFLIFLNSAISLSTSPTHAWYELPVADPWWHQIVRAIVYSYVAWKFGSLMYIVVLRRFWPNRLPAHVTQIDEDTLGLVTRSPRRAKK